MKKNIILSGMIIGLLCLSACSGGGGESAKATYYKDADLDGYGDAATSKELKTSKEESDANGNKYITDDDGSVYVTNDDDCNDANASISPAETADPTDSVDNDCDGETDEDAAAAVIEVDADGDGITVDTDCDDNDATVGAATPWYVDADADGYGDSSATSQSSCTQPSGYVSDATDCDDTDASAYSDCSGSTLPISKITPVSGGTYDLNLNPRSGNGGKDGEEGGKDGEEGPDAEDIDWSMNAIWRGGGVYNDLACGTDLDFNSDITELASYIGLDRGGDNPNFDASTGTATLEFTLNSLLDSLEFHDTPGGTVEDLDYKGYWSGIAYNTNTIQSMDGYVKIECTDALASSEGKCSEESTINLVNDGEMGASFVNSADQAIVVLRGFYHNYNNSAGDGMAEFQDAAVSVELTEDSPTDQKVKLKVTTNFDGGAGTNDYANVVYYTIFVLETSGGRVATKSFEGTNPDCESKSDGTCDATFEKSLSLGSISTSTDSDNVLLGLTSWGFYSDESNIEIKRVSAYAKLKEWTTSSTGNGTAKIYAAGSAHSEACGADTDANRAANSMKYVMLVCQDDHVCKVQNEEIDSWKDGGNNSGSTVTEKRTLQITGLPETE